LIKALPPGTCLSIGTSHVQTAVAAASGADKIVVTQPYSVDSAKYNPKSVLKASKGTMVFFLGYDHGNLVSCTGKGTDSFQNGSSIVSLAQASSVGEFQGRRGGLVQAPAESALDAAAEAPYFCAPSHSTSLKLRENIAFSMFGRAATTPACSGLTFESWIKISGLNHSATTIVTYTSEKQARSDGGEKENQRFVLAAIPKGGQTFSLEGNINGQLFDVNSSPPLRADQWAHVACAVTNMYSLRLGGADYVDFGTAAEFNLTDFSVMFHIQFDQIGGSEQLMLTKSASPGSPTPLQVVITEASCLRFSFWPDDGDGGNDAKRSPLVCNLDQPLKSGVPYKIFISRRMVNPKSKSQAPRQGHLVTMKVWSAERPLPFALNPPTLSELENPSLDGKDAKSLFIKPGAVACGLPAATDAPLLLGGAPSVTGGVQGRIGGFQIWSTAVEPPDDLSKWKAESAAKSCVASYSFASPEGRVLFDGKNRNHGKLKGSPQWTASPFAGDGKLSVYINGNAQETRGITGKPDPQLSRQKSPHQLTLGNAVRGENNTRMLARKASFQGELDELRIWEVARSRESICDAMYGRLTEVPPEIAVYLPFDDLLPTAGAMATPGIHSPCIRDESVNCWHLSVVGAGEPELVPSGAPVGSDAACVTPALRSGPATQPPRKIQARPSVAEYGDLTVGASGAMEGSLKRAYGFIDSDTGVWVLVTGFKIGALITEWVSQVQTSPTLIGYMEGAPPIPAENFASKEDKPFSAIRFVNASKCSYSYSSRRETGLDTTVTSSRGIGAKWKANAGLGVETEVSAGEIKGALKSVVDISDSSLTNEMSTTTSHATLDMRVETTGSWSTTGQGQDGKEHERYDPANTGVALVESEVADVFALRLKLRGPVKPLVAYQMRPNPDIPKDRNLVSFRINPMYTKQGCLDGHRGLEADEAYPMAGKDGPPRDLSYFKPAEAYALKDRIRRAEEQLAGEHERYELSSKSSRKDLPKRNKRNICNSYAWTAAGGTFQETLSTMDFVQLEVGGNSNVKMGIGGTFDAEVSVTTVLTTTNVDALVATHFNLMLTKESNSETSFELQVEMPLPIDIRQQDPSTSEWNKRPGAVDAYRWMSFWLEPSVDATAAFFQQVVDPIWLQQSSDLDAVALRSLSESLKVEKQDAKTKAWRVFHRCTYVSRVPASISSPGAAAAAAAEQEESDKKGLHDYAPSWTLVSTLEPYVRPAKNKGEVAAYAKPLIQLLYPALERQPRLLDQVLNMLVAYLDVPDTGPK
jgi:hypothetical protein